MTQATFIKYLDRQGFTALAAAIRDKKTTPRRAAAHLLEYEASILKATEVRTLRKITGKA